MDLRSLERIGLTHNESRVYITLLKVGTSKTGEILKQSNLNSGKIYEILERLKNKGLVSESIINNVKHFAAAPPTQLLEYLKEKKKTIQKDEKIIRAAIPDLDNIRKLGIKEVKSVTYKGLRGIKTAADEALESMSPHDDTLVMGATKYKDKRFNEFWKSWSKRRITKKLFLKIIFSEKSDYFDSFKKMKYTEARVLTAFTPVAVNVFGEDKVLILNYAESPSCILIYDKNTATSFRHFFNQLWNLSKPQ